MTKQEIVEKLKTELDINQRLFLAGKFHSTEFNKWFNDVLTEFEQAVREETLKELIREFNDSELEGTGYDFYFSIRAKLDDIKKLNKYN